MQTLSPASARRAVLRAISPGPIVSAWPGASLATSAVHHTPDVGLRSRPGTSGPAHAIAPKTLPLNQRGAP